MDELLSENIELRGFRDVDKITLNTVKTEASDFAAKMEKCCTNFEKLQIVMKPIHENEKSSKFEIQAKLMDNGKTFAAVNTDKNMFLAMNKVFTKIENEIKH